MKPVHPFQEYGVHELQRQVEQKKKAVEEANTVLWKTEQALSKYDPFVSVCLPGVDGIITIFGGKMAFFSKQRYDLFLH
jgi:hypothetical protein